jgi:hypothetical protein
MRIWGWVLDTSDIVEDPIHRFFNIQDPEILHRIPEFCIVWGRKEGFSMVEGDHDYAFFCEVVALVLGVAAGAGYHSTAVDVDKHLVREIYKCCDTVGRVREMFVINSMTYR